MKVKRYDLQQSVNGAAMQRHEQGRYVLASDFDALLKLADDLAAAVIAAAEVLEEHGGELPVYRALYAEWQAFNV